MGQQMVNELPFIIVPTRLGKPSPVPGRVEGGGQPVLSFEQCFIYFF